MTARAAGALLVLAAGCGRVEFLPGQGEWPAAVVPPWSHQVRLVVTDDAEDTLAVVSAEAAPKVLGFEPVGDDPLQIEAPHHLSASPDGQTLYVNLSEFAPGTASGPVGGQIGLGSANGYLVKVRASDYQKVAEAMVDRDPGDSIVTRDGATAYVSHYDLLKVQDQLLHGLPETAGYSTVAAVDTATMTVKGDYPVCATSHGLALSADESKLYIACSLADQMAILDLATHTATRLVVGPGAGTLGQPAYFPFALTVSPSDGTVWISCNGGPGGWAGVRVYDPAKQAMDDGRAVQLNGVAMFADWLPDGKTLILPHQGDDRVSVIDTTTSTETASIGLPSVACLRAHMVRVAADGRLAWLTCEGQYQTGQKGTLVALDLAANAFLGYAELGLYPDGVVLLPPAP